MRSNHIDRYIWWDYRAQRKGEGAATLEEVNLMECVHDLWLSSKGLFEDQRVAGALYLSLVEALHGNGVCLNTLTMGDL